MSRDCRLLRHQTTRFSSCQTKIPTPLGRGEGERGLLKKKSLSRKKRKFLLLKDTLSRLPADFCWHLLERLLRELSGELPSDFVSALSLVIRRRDVAGYYQLENSWGLHCMSPKMAEYASSLASIRLLTSIIRKSDYLPLVQPKERKQACLESVRTLDGALLSRGSTWWDDPVFSEARLFLAGMLGASPSTEEIVHRAKHGPGSTSTIGFSERSKFFKLATFPYACSPSARPLLQAAIQADSRWLGSVEDAYRERYRIPKWRLLNRDAFWAGVIHDEYSFNRISSVPKDGRKDRPIAMEPTYNQYLQLGVGQCIRKRLAVAGVDLNRQQVINRNYALSSSLDGSLFTIDLSNASDTVSTEFVREMLPPDWFSLLNSLRSPYGLLPDGNALVYQKFSSMGNGYTFELETVLFLAICRAISRVYGSRRDRIAVFGDDIIGESYLYRHHSIYLASCGFQVNPEKSFSAGPVRESCGVEGYLGVDIRPVFLKGKLTNCMHLYNLRNRLRSWFFNHWGSFPLSVDSYLLSYLRCEPHIGPDSVTEFDSYLHDGFWAAGRRFTSLSLPMVEIPARDLRFRKLMHSLASCNTDGGNFVVGAASETRAVEVDRVVDPGFPGNDYKIGLVQVDIANALPSQPNSLT